MRRHLRDVQRLPHLLPGLKAEAGDPILGDGDADGGVAVEAAQVGQVVEFLVNTRNQAQRDADPLLFVGKGSEYFASAEGLRRGFGDGLGFPTDGESRSGRCDREGPRLGFLGNGR